MAIFSINKDGSNMSQSVSLILYKIKQLQASGKDVTVRVLSGAHNQRTLEQNDRLQAACGDLAEQMRLCTDGKWRSTHENGAGQQFSKDDWRHIIVAAYKRQQIVPGINGEMVVLGASSRDLSVADCSECLDMLYSFGMEHEVRWSEDALEELPAA